MTSFKKTFAIIYVLMFFGLFAQAQPVNRKLFNDNWQFKLDDSNNTKENHWISLNLPHDWSIMLPFDSTSPTGNSGGALRGGLGWYKKYFSLPASAKDKKIFIDFDGVYMNSEVIINGTSLGIRPNGYISFRYDLTPYVKFGNEKNTIQVKVDNSKQPNSRWYSGSGIYRNVWLTISNPVHIALWGTYVTTPIVSKKSADIKLQTTIANDIYTNKTITLISLVYDAGGKLIQKKQSEKKIDANAITNIDEQLIIENPVLWNPDRPYLYKIVSKILQNGKVVDEYQTALGIRYFTFDIDKGFFLNGNPLKIRGVCNHHDLGCLGAAMNTRALQRQLQILKEMGCNAIRTSHNPPAPELLQLCDEMGFIVMDEAFDMWKAAKSKYDYHLYWDEWHKKDLQNQILRDRNHPSVFIWSLGNEIMEQWENHGSKNGSAILKELCEIVKSLDSTRPTVTANNSPESHNILLQANQTDLIGYNYSPAKWNSVFQDWYRKPFIIAESTSALATRGSYDMPSDSIRRWPAKWDTAFKNSDKYLTCSAYDNCSTPWGSTHEETLKIVENYPHISGLFIWTGFDYLGEPTPYPWPARSSYFGIVDLAGFPKDAYYMYQSVWTNTPVLHLFPHWNHTTNEIVDVWAYYNNADEVELFINGKSQGIRKKSGTDLHVMWRVQYEPGILKAVSRKNGKVVLTKEIKTAGKPAKIVLQADRNIINADGTDLSFITARIIDKNGNFVALANNEINFEIDGNAAIAATDNGLQTDLTSFQSKKRKAWKGLCLAVIKASKQKGIAKIKASSPGLQSATISITLK
jgi:beta-galactosidase